MNEDLEHKLKYLRLGQLCSQWDTYLKQAAKQRMSHARFLQHVVEEEYRIKQENATRLRLKRARIPEEWVMDTFPFHLQPKLNKKRVLALYDSFEFINKKENIIWVGSTGCGKTGLATSFLIHAIHQGYRGKYILFPELVSELYQSVADHSEKKVTKRYLSYDCLLIDELGYVEMEREQVGLFFALMQKRHKNKSTLITSNLGFSEWGSFLKSTHLTAALADRLTENSHVFNMKKCVSLRSRLKQTL